LIHDQFPKLVGAGSGDKGAFQVNHMRDKLALVEFLQSWCLWL